MVDLRAVLGSVYIVHLHIFSSNSNPEPLFFTLFIEKASYSYLILVIYKTYHQSAILLLIDISANSEIAITQELF